MSLFDSYTLGKHSLSNRIVLAPMTTYSSQPNGDISDDELPYLQRRAKGGIATITTAACCVHPSGHAFAGQWHCSDDRHIPSLKSVADAIHAGGGLAILQIHHGGRQCPPELAGGECISASAIPMTREGAPVPREMTTDEIERTIQDFAQATRRAKLAGFDGVEIHGANTYLIQQFVSPHSNRRTDEWAADTFRFPIELTKAVLAEAGEDFIVGYRFSPEEPETPGIRLERTEELLSHLIKLPLSYLHISLRNFAQVSIHDESSEPTLTRIARITQAANIPLIGVGSVKSREDAENCLALGADLVAVGRVAISEPEWGQKAKDGSPIRTKLPNTDFAELLNVPRGLTDKIRSIPGWFEIEDE